MPLVRGGGVAIFNEGSTDWTQRDVIKPNATHSVQGTLKAGAGDSSEARAQRVNEE